MYRFDAIISYISCTMLEKSRVILTKITIYARFNPNMSTYGEVNELAIFDVRFYVNTCLRECNSLLLLYDFHIILMFHFVKVLTISDFSKTVKRYFGKWQKEKSRTKLIINALTEMLKITFFCWEFSVLSFRNLFL